MLIMPTCSQAVGNLLSNFPVRLTTIERFEYLIKPLDAPFGAGKGSFFFQTRRSRQYNIRIAAGIAEEDVLHHKEVELGECISDIVSIGVDDAHFLADEIHRLELARMYGFDHLVVVESLGGRQFDLPPRLKPLAYFGIIHGLIAWQHVGHGPVVAGSLHIIVAAQRISAGSRSHVVARDQ